MKKLIAVLCSLALLCCVAGCSEAQPLELVGKATGITLPQGELAQNFDSHGGFHGDGLLFYAIELGHEQKGGIVAQIENTEGWHRLPLEETLTAAVYGVSDGNRQIGPYITNNGEPVFPEITNGYYFFLDRHSASSDKFDPTEILTRSSQNLTLAIFDSDASILYYCEFDT